MKKLQNMSKMVMPNISPLDAIVHLCKISNSNSIQSITTYLFYETTKGFHFRSIDGLASQEPAYDYKENIPNTVDEKGTIDPIKNLQTINDSSCQYQLEILYIIWKTGSFFKIKVT